MIRNALDVYNYSQELTSTELESWHSTCRAIGRSNSFQGALTIFLRRHSTPIEGQVVVHLVIPQTSFNWSAAMNSTELRDFVLEMLSVGFVCEGDVDIGNIVWSKWSRTSTELETFTHDDVHLLQLIPYTPSRATTLDGDNIRVVIPSTGIMIDSLTRSEHLLLRGFTKSHKTTNSFCDYWTVTH